LEKDVPDPMTQGGVCGHLISRFSGPELSSAFSMQKGRLTLSARIYVGAISISETVGKGAAERAPRKTDSLSAPGAAK
jgi:hypothetical protein